MTLKELAGYDGREGRPAYIAVNGTVYDVTSSPRWENGLHPPDHLAGQELSEELAKAPHVRAVIERFPVIGTIVAGPLSQASGGSSKTAAVIIIAIIVVAIAIFLLI